MKRLAGVLAAFILMASCASQPPASSTIWRIPPGFRIVGYFPSWSGDASSIEYKALTHIDYAFALVDSSGVYRPLDAPQKLQDVTARAHAAGCKAMISLGGWNEGDTSAFEKISGDSQLLATFVQNTLAFIKTYQLDGVDLDWEFPGEKTAAGYAALTQALAEALHPIKAELSLAVTATEGRGKYFTDEALKSADWINIMAYDGGSKSPPVSHSTYAYARASLDYWLKQRNLPPQKVVLGVPFYGRSLADRHSRSYYLILKEFPQAAMTDVIGGFAYNGNDTMRAKVVNQARYRAAGVMIWQLNQDANGQDSLLHLIYDTVKEPVE